MLSKLKLHFNLHPFHLPWHFHWEIIHETLSRFSFSFRAISKTKHLSSAYTSTFTPFVKTFTSISFAHCHQLSWCIYIENKNVSCILSWGSALTVGSMLALSVPNGLQTPEIFRQDKASAKAGNVSVLPLPSLLCGMEYIEANVEFFETILKIHDSFYMEPLLWKATFRLRGELLGLELWFGYKFGRLIFNSLELGVWKLLKLKIYTWTDGEKYFTPEKLMNRMCKKLFAMPMNCSQFNLKHFHYCSYRISMETAGLPIPAYSYIAPNHIVKAPH